MLFRREHRGVGKGALAPCPPFSRCEDGGYASLCPHPTAAAVEISLIQIRLHLREHAAEHVRRQHPRIGVVAGAVVAVVKLYRTGLMDRAMPEWRCGIAHAERLQRCFMR